MDLWDGGAGSASIAIAIGETPERVMQIVARYAGGEGGPKHERLTRVAAISANASYLAAIAAMNRRVA